MEPSATASQVEIGHSPVDRARIYINVIGIQILLETSLSYYTQFKEV